MRRGTPPMRRGERGRVQGRAMSAASTGVMR